MRCSRPALVRLDATGCDMPAARSWAKLTTPCWRAAILAITKSHLAGCMRIWHVSRQLPCLSPFIAGFRASHPSSPVFQAKRAEVRPPYDQRAMAASAQYSVTVRVELDARQEPLGK